MADAPGEPLDDDLIREQLRADLEDLARYRMPFGRYQDRALFELPLEYLQWFRDRAGGFPTGRLGELMAFVCQTKSDGAEIIFEPLRAASRSGRPRAEGPRRRRRS